MINVVVMTDVVVMINIIVIINVIYDQCSCYDLFNYYYYTYNCNDQCIFYDQSNIN